MSRAPMQDLKRALQRHGLRIEPAAFVRLVVRALDDQPTLLVGPSVTELSAAERAELEASGFDLTRRQRRGGGPLERSHADYLALIATSLSVTTAARRLGVHPTRIRQRLRQTTLYGFKVQSQWVLPAFQFSGRRTLPGLERIVPAIPEGQHPLSVFYLFMTPQSELRHPDLDQEMSPRDWLLLSLRPEPVAELVAALAIA